MPVRLPHSGGGVGGYQWLDLLQDSGYLILNHTPNTLKIDPIVVVNQNVTHSRHIFPGDFGVLRSKFI
jgi:hypothetical protein